MSRLLQALLIGLALTLPILAVAEAPAILLANVYRDQVDVSRYLASEKLDGVRAIWDGQALRFRSGKPINAPGWFLAGLPNQPLDGELWIARGQFERLSGIVRRDIPDDAAWREVRYMIFELPGAPGTFSERAEQIRRIVCQANVPWLFEIKQFFPVDRGNLKKRLDEVVRGGGEGLMLHLADAPYETGRSDVLLKVKPWQDAEAVVIGHQPGKGRFAGMLGALKVRTPEGMEFLLGTGFSAAQRREPPALGAMVTYRYRDLTGGGLPRFASFLRIRDE
ncbi:DNA ligase [Ferribacterium limneticum]|uniref:DNA ligase n=1 Tax=Ferribacterium limneticum TaxID=76259 RepID=UPI001CF828A7|nr:DNA ligase [Ferribacterium limneticum]UCV24213.1 DNA ligase [Ferribacterium limneticum]